MVHNLEVKKEVLKLLNDGYNIAEINRQTGVTEKTIRVWRDKWKEADKDKTVAIEEVYKELNRLTKKPLENGSKIKTLSATLVNLRKDLLINSKYYDL